jgi:hypothetical protein
MVGGADDALVWAVALTTVLLLPLVSWLIAGVGSEISAAVDADAEADAEAARRVRDAGA